MLKILLVVVVKENQKMGKIATAAASLIPSHGLGDRPLLHDQQCPRPRPKPEFLENTFSSGRNYQETLATAIDRFFLKFQFLNVIFGGL